MIEHPVVLKAYVDLWIDRKGRSDKGSFAGPRAKDALVRYDQL